MVVRRAGEAGQASGPAGFVGPGWIRVRGEAVVWRPTQLHFPEAGHPAAERGEGFVKGFFGAENRRHPPVGGGLGQGFECGQLGRTEQVGPEFRFHARRVFEIDAQAAKRGGGGDRRRAPSAAVAKAAGPAGGPERGPVGGATDVRIGYAASPQQSGGGGAHSGGLAAAIRRNGEER